MLFDCGLGSVGAHYGGRDWGRSVRALVDTGSKFNILDMSLVPRGVRSSPTNISLVAANGSKMCVKGVIRDILIEISGRVFAADFVVCGMPRRECILGCEFLRKHHLEMVFRLKGVTLCTERPVNAEKLGKCRISGRRRSRC